MALQTGNKGKRVYHRGAERAEQLLTKLLNAKADTLEARARKAEAQKNYARAIQLYELYLTYFSEAARYSEVAQHLKALKKRTTQ